LTVAVRTLPLAHQPFGRRTAAFLHSGMMVPRGSVRTATVKAGRSHDRGLPLSFAEPLLLAGPVEPARAVWLLRVMPPQAAAHRFPPTRLLFDIAPKEETPSRTPCG